LAADHRAGTRTPIFWPGDVKFDNPAGTGYPSEDVGARGKDIGDPARRMNPAVRRTRQGT
jgi:hypothetical protein